MTTKAQATQPDFEMVRINRSKRVVDISPNTIRAYAENGRLRLYKVGKACFFSRSELEAAIRSGAVTVRGHGPAMN